MNPNISANHREMLFYAKVINLTILDALGTIAAAQTSGKIET